MINVERCKRGVSADPSCMICRSVEESCTHVLRDCCQAREAWKQIFSFNLSVQFFPQFSAGLNLGKFEKRVQPGISRWGLAIFLWYCLLKALETKKSCGF